jgi:putative ABC transport system permease protein
LRRHRDLEEGKEDFVVQTPEQLIEGLNSVLNIVNAIVIGIAAISLIVGGIGITNTMYTAVLERTKEIGIMKSIGAKNGNILAIFLVESGLLGLAGGAIGVALGYAFSKLVEVAAAQFWASDILRANFPLWLLLGALAFSFLIGMIAGTTPAIQASKQKPVDSLRYE